MDTSIGHFDNGEQITPETIRSADAGRAVSWEGYRDDSDIPGSREAVKELLERYYGKNALKELQQERVMTVSALENKGVSFLLEGTGQKYTSFKISYPDNILEEDKEKISELLVKLSALNIAIKKVEDMKLRE